MRFVVLLFGNLVSSRTRLIMKAVHSDGTQTHWVRWFRQETAEAEASDIVLPAPEWSVRLAWKMPAYWSRMYRICKPMQGNSTIFIATHFFQLPVLILLRGKRVYDAAEMYSIDLAQYFDPFKKLIRPLIALVEGMMVSRLDGVLTVDSRSGWLAHHFRRWNRHVQVVWNVPALAEDPEPSLVGQLRSAYEGRRVVAYVGGLMREKGLRVALQAAALVRQNYPEVLFLFIGSMKDDVVAVHALIRELGIEAHVSMLGQMPYREMQAHLRHSEIGLALHQKERIYVHVAAGNGRKFFTYMQAGLAIIGPDFGEVGKAVELTQCGVLVDTHKPQAVACAIIDLFSRPEEMRAMQQGGRKAFEDRFHWEKEQEKVIRFFEEICK